MRQLLDKFEGKSTFSNVSNLAEIGDCVLSRSLRRVSGPGASVVCVGERGLSETWDRLVGLRYGCILWYHSNFLCSVPEPGVCFLAPLARSLRSREGDSLRFNMGIRGEDVHEGLVEKNLPVMKGIKAWISRAWVLSPLSFLCFFQSLISLAYAKMLSQPCG